MRVDYAEYRASNNLLRRYVPGAGVDETAAWYEGATLTNKRWALADERGSVIAWTDDDGDTDLDDGGPGGAAINRYDAFGVPAATNVGRIQYTGQMWLAEIGLYHYKARAYHPALGRFLQTDPMGMAGGVNLYAYVGNDPVNLTDPSGLGYCFTLPDGDSVCLAGQGTDEEIDEIKRPAFVADSRRATKTMGFEDDQDRIERGLADLRP